MYNSYNLHCLPLYAIPSREEQQIMIVARHYGADSNNNKSANTLWICGYHLLTFTLLKGLLVYVLGIDISKFESTIMPNIFFSLAALFVCLYTTLFIKAVSRPNA